MLYRTAEWHALAKLRIHTDSSLTLLEKLTAEFGQLLRKFRDVTCSTFSTVELPRETAARNRREIHTKRTATSSEAVASSRLAMQPLNDPLPAAQEEILPAAGTGKYTFKLGLYFSAYDSDSNAASEQSRRLRSGRKPMVLNLHTIKLHFLGDYVQHIRTFGTTDSYSTQLVCACFCLH